MEAINQSRTYEGLLEGLPTQEINQRIIEYALQHAKLSYLKDAPHLIAPAETPLDYESRHGKKYPFGTPATIPPVVCEARFKSFETARDTSKDYSCLCVVWFQDEFALPIADSIVEALKQLDWVSLARDAEY